MRQWQNFREEKTKWLADGGISIQFEESFGLGIERRSTVLDSWWRVEKDGESWSEGWVP